MKIVDDPNATVADFVKAGQKYCVGESEDPTTGQSVYTYETATQDGKYASNDFEGITCRVCHVLNSTGLALRKPNDTCTQCHGRVYNWTSGSGHHVEQDFFVGHGETSYSPSVHYTVGMQCQDCHTMDSTKHDYAPASPEAIVANPKCSACHQDADELANIIKTTQTTVTDSLTALNDRITKAQDAITNKTLTDSNGLVAKAKARVSFITGDYSNGVHNPQFAGKLINEANQYLDQLYSLTGTSATPTLTTLSNLTVYSQAQSSQLGSAHWSLFSSNIVSDDPEQDHCIVCHSAVSIVDDSTATMADFVKAGQKYCTAETDAGFTYTTATTDGKYATNYAEGITCRVCHTFDQPGHIALRRSDEQTCGLCHGRDFTWNTGSGHHVELAFFKGQGSSANAVASTPSFKSTMGFSCQDCHFMDSTKHDYQPATAEQIAASPKCSGCHTSAAQVQSLIDKTQTDTKAGLAKLQPRLDAAKAYVGAHPDNATAKTTYTQALAGVNFINGDYSNGVHNPQFAAYLIKRSTLLLDYFETTFK